MKELTGGHGVDIVYDPIGAQVAEESLRCLAWCGRLLILGFLGGGPTDIRSNYLLIKGIDAIGVRIGGLNEADPELAIANMQALNELAATGQAETAHLASFSAGTGSRGDAGGDRPQGDRQGGADGLTAGARRQAQPTAPCHASITSRQHSILFCSLQCEVHRGHCRLPPGRRRREYCGTGWSSGALPD